MDRDIRFLHGGRGKTHYFSREETHRIIDNETFLDRKTAFALALDTGARVGEVTEMRVEHFDFQKESVIHWDSKKKAWKTVPLSKEAIQAVQLFLHATRRKGGPLFAVTTRTLNRWLQDACKREEITPDTGRRIRWHSWRGTFVRLNRDKGDKWLMQVTGDSYQTLLQYYEDLTEEDMRRIKRGEDL